MKRRKDSQDREAESYLVNPFFVQKLFKYLIAGDQYLSEDQFWFECQYC